MIFKVAYKKGQKTLVKIAGLDPEDTKGDGTWAKCDDKVYNWAKGKYKEGDEIDVDYTESNGEYTVGRITALGGGSKKTEVNEESKYKCKECGKELKDDKYESCYSCNQKNPNKSGGTGAPGKGAPYGSLMPEEATRRNKLALVSSICTAMASLTGQVSPDTMPEIIIAVYDKLYKKLFG